MRSVRLIDAIGVLVACLGAVVGRIGKLSQFIGGLVTIIDVIGPDRLREWGERLRSRPIEPRRQTFVATLRHSRSIYRQVFGDMMDDWQRWANSRPGSPGYGQRVARRTLSAEAQRVRRLVRIGFLLLAVSPVLLGFALTVVLLVSNLVARGWPVVMYYLLVWSPLTVLNGPQPDRSLRVAGGVDGGRRVFV